MTFIDWMEPSEAMDLHMRACERLEKLGYMPFYEDMEDGRCMLEQVLMQ